MTWLYLETGREDEAISRPDKSPGSTLLNLFNQEGQIGRRKTQPRSRYVAAESDFTTANVVQLLATLQEFTPEFTIEERDETRLWSRVQAEEAYGALVRYLNSIRSTQTTSSSRCFTPAKVWGKGQSKRFKIKRTQNLNFKTGS